MTSSQQDRLREIARRISAGAFEGLEQFFSTDFRLHDPNAPDWPQGGEGARLMLRKFAELGDDVRLTILDMVEHDDEVAVRWSVAWTQGGARREAAIIAIYRFESGLIAEDWGIAARAPW
jgi:hypothetical protein